MIELVLDSFIDSIKLIPFLFITFLFIELLEHKFSNRTVDIIKKSGKFGPLLGGILGAFPQCGFSVMATNLYITRIISLGTLIAIYLSTSDEMLPILISHGASIFEIGKILLIKISIGIFFGFIVDIFIKRDSKEHYNICEEEHCHCEKGIIKSSVKHTINIFIFIFGISFILNIIMDYFGEDIVRNLFNGHSIISPMIASLIGIIPNCGASVIITELYLSNVIPLSSAIAGLLTNSGVALIVLFRSNKDLYDNLKVLFLIYSIGVVSGLIIEMLEFIF